MQATVKAEILRAFSVFEDVAITLEGTAKLSGMAPVQGVFANRYLDEDADIKEPGKVVITGSVLGLLHVVPADANIRLTTSTKRLLMSLDDGTVYKIKTSQVDMKQPQKHEATSIELDAQELRKAFKSIGKVGADTLLRLTPQGGTLESADSTISAIVKIACNADKNRTFIVPKKAVSVLNGFFKRADVTVKIALHGDSATITGPRWDVHMEASTTPAKTHFKGNKAYSISLDAEKVIGFAKMLALVDAPCSIKVENGHLNGSTESDILTGTTSIPLVSEAEAPGYTVKVNPADLVKAAEGCRKHGDVIELSFGGKMSSLIAMSAGNCEFSIVPLSQ